jgi:hypothetical protein
VERRRTASALMRRRVLSREWHADGLGEAAPIAQVAHGLLAGIHDGEEGQVVAPVLEMLVSAVGYQWLKARSTVTGARPML